MDVLIVYDGKRGPTATQMISFGQPFDPANGTAPARISFEKHYTDPAEVEKAFASHRPDVIVLSRYTSDRGQDWIRLCLQGLVMTVGSLVAYQIGGATALLTTLSSDNSTTTPESMAVIRSTSSEAALTLMNHVHCARLSGGRVSWVISLMTNMFGFPSTFCTLSMMSDEVPSPCSSSNT